MSDLSLGKFLGALELSEEELLNVAGGAGSESDRKYKIGDTVYAVMAADGKLFTYTVVDFAGKQHGVYAYKCERKDAAGVFDILQEGVLDYGAKEFAARQAGNARGVNVF